jgi:predicted Zn-dependent peptidase
MEQRITALNGVNIYYYMQPNTHSICLSLYIKAGTLYEDTAPGITHFLEHLHFRRLGGRTQKELYYQLESIGGYLGACTYKEFLRFYLTASPQYFSQLVKIASDLLVTLKPI